MGWISVEDRMPPQGLEVLLEVSGYFTPNYLADHNFFLGCWMIPSGRTEGKWLIWDSCEGEDNHISDPTVHAWMPLPKHYQPQETFGTQDDDGYEQPMFEEESPEWLYKGDCIYEQMTLEEFMGGATNDT